MKIKVIFTFFAGLALPLACFTSIRQAEPQKYSNNFGISFDLHYLLSCCAERNWSAVRKKIKQNLFFRSPCTNFAVAFEKAFGM